MQLIYATRNLIFTKILPDGEKPITYLKSGLSQDMPQDISQNDY